MHLSHPTSLIDSDVAIEAADLVLLDSFSAIITGIEYGRLVFDNLKKVMSMHTIALMYRCACT